MGYWAGTTRTYFHRFSCNNRTIELADSLIVKQVISVRYEHFDDSIVLSGCVGILTYQAAGSLREYRYSIETPSDSDRQVFEMRALLRLDNRRTDVERAG